MPARAATATGLPFVACATTRECGTLLSGERRLHDGQGAGHHHLGVSGFAQYAVLAANSLVRVPSDLPFAEAAVALKGIEELVVIQLRN